ncbi:MULTISPECIES: helix-turn-helix transcriptional regulator [unclassified Streptomyces]|uniref:helix-turn-helix domain-containing protein n=1 Tax=unclassified Streptomyces TaxID=2593676 RepID=UPI001F03BA2E|nr:MULTISPECIES: helix-turn-helix transcriptional regulator [unclassified Streptomyces]MCH0563945.1 helix-turn-helix domain-containing protein [Streptomyces sp. MUM 2J]MCH0570712.1 helix-turn-helix domain-containing protein [Streptomyces sp. MUM 136J]
MGGWQQLPDGLPPQARHLVTRLRDLKDGTGLSLAALGARTAYSKSSWQRYLNAVQPPPRQAVAALAEVAGLDPADAERLAVRWELAMEDWPRPEPLRPGAEGDYQEDPTVPWWERPEPPPPRPEQQPPSVSLLLWAVLLLLALLLTAVVGAVAAG